MPQVTKCNGLEYEHVTLISPKCIGEGGRAGKGGGGGT